MALCEGVVCGSSLLWPRVLLFGDSTTQKMRCSESWIFGLQYQMGEDYPREANRKGSSLDSPAAGTVFFGASDSALKGENPKQRIPLEEYVANLTSTVQHLQSVGVPESRLIRITPPPAAL
ncbi:isoamyl acetate-hydrolyzing esterase 1 homolog [Globicephala melas]|uniref:isoamyl acetate-hydrolyzing esterase 1 homolog n=1 Tax=Globicephala melas TaxID=9731 RepID=UPI003872B701